MSERDELAPRDVYARIARDGIAEARAALRQAREAANAAELALHLTEAALDDAEDPPLWWRNTVDTREVP